MALMHALDVRLGFTFSAGLFDYLLSFGKGHNGLLLLPVGLAYGLVYYLLFSFFIRRFKLPTMGREEGGAAPAAPVASGSARAQGLLVALGGAANLRSVDACTTRLRLQVADNGAIDAAALRALGARGVIMPAPGSVQVVLGPEADQVADQLRALQGQAPQPPAAAMPPPPVPPAELRLDRRAWLLALGGEANVQRIEAVAGTRLRVVLGDAARVDEAALLGLGALGLQSFSPALVHVLLADAAAAHAALLAERAGP